MTTRCIKPVCNTMKCSECSCAITDQEQEIIRHTLMGGQQQRFVFRNYYVAGVNHNNSALLQRLVSLGLMEGVKKNSEMVHYYRCTKAGAAAVGLMLPSLLPA